MIDMAKRVALGLAVTLVFFVVIEGILWVAGVAPLHQRADPYVGFAGYSPLFVERTMPDGSHVLATASGKMRWFNPQHFPARKATGVVRVFCMGGSTTYGRPYDDRTSFCGWLRAFLPAVDPDRRFEVINAGGISYASYRVVRLMEALSRHEPDLFIVYTGHNEFLEDRTYGRLQNTPEFVRDLASLASRLRLYSVMSDVIVDRGEVLSKEVDAVLDRSVGPEDYHRDDPLQDAVLEHFRVSLARMAGISDRVGAEVIFVTPASNIKDFSPFKVEPSAELSSQEVAQVAELKRSAFRALEENDPQRADDLTAWALATDPRDAEAHFLQGRALLALGQPQAARKAFVSARDEDIAPLRALSPMPGIIAEVAREQRTGLVDFARMVEERSPDRIPGEELFLDHVHPTIEGNRMLALALIDEMIRMGIVTPAMTWDDTAVATITARVSDGVDEADHARARRSLANVLIWAGKHEEAGRLVDESAGMMPHDGESNFQRATLLVREGQYAEALPYLEEAVRLSPQEAAISKEYGIVLSELGRKAEARRALETAIRLDPGLAGAHYELGVVLSELGDHAQAEVAYRTELATFPDHADTCNNLGVLLATRGEIEAALALFERAVRSDPSNANAVDNLAQARAILGR
jgi:Flp pilus assembly protein TadD